jgi:predicted dehydrogenase
MRMDREQRIRIGLTGDGADTGTWAAALEQFAIVEPEPDVSSSLDAIAVCQGTPDPFARAKQALLAGQDVLYAAPFLLSPWQAALLERAAEAQGRVLRFVELFQHQPGFAFLQRLTRGDEAFSSPLYLRVLRLGRPDGRIDPLAVEQLAVCDALLAGEPSRMTASGVRQGDTADVRAVFLTLHYAGAVVQLTVSLTEGQEACQVVVAMPERTVVVDQLDPLASLRVYDCDSQEERLLNSDPAMDGPKIIASGPDVLADEAGIFVRAVAARRGEATNAPRWTRVAGLWWAARQSMALGGVTDVPLASAGLAKEAPAFRVIEGGGRSPAIGKRPPLAVVSG